MSPAGRQHPRRGTSPLRKAKRGRPPAAEERWKYPAWAQGRGAGAKWLCPKLFARGLRFSADVRCCHEAHKKWVAGLASGRMARFGVPLGCRGP